MSNYCGDCKHYKPNLNQGAVAPGECRRLPPQINKYFLPPNTLQIDVSYPPLQKNHFACGEFEKVVVLQ